MSAPRLLDYWSPPEGAGEPVAALATTFTFQADFFDEDCLSRFLSLSSVPSEGDRISSIAAVLEMEDRLSEVQVSVLADRSTASEKRNLRWDLLPVAAPGGLLHAKVAVLLWERAGRVVVGSANLTPAGYRQQVETAIAIDLDSNCSVPRSVLDDLVSELRVLVELAPDDPGLAGPKSRASATLDLLTERVQALSLPITGDRNLRLAVAPARPGRSPLDQLRAVWRGPQPLWATVLSPFWDDAAPAPALDAIGQLLTGRPASRRGLVAVAAVDPRTEAVKAPVSMARQRGLDLVAFEPDDAEQRLLHAKVLVVESDEWVAAMIGSSNATEAGYRLHPRRGHHELNVWIGCPAGSKEAKALRALTRAGAPIDLDDAVWDPDHDEDEPTAPTLPLGFQSCVVQPDPPAVTLTFSRDDLPVRWTVNTPTDIELLDVSAWRAEGSPETVSIPLPDAILPAFLAVRWADAEGQVRATWTANVEDRGALPPPEELRDLPVALLLEALASTRPLPEAVERELRRQERAAEANGRAELDPLKRFDDRSLLLQRTRRVSLALMRLEERLARPASSLDALRWRLQGPFGPLAIADGLLAADGAGDLLPGEPHFLLAELALTVAAVDWEAAAPKLPKTTVRRVVSEAIQAIDLHRAELSSSADGAIDRYVTDALKAAAR
ncbi:MAG: hypothetical protein JNK12_13040 [Acidimicrobiales bacterium]|nr:hypothetical protein [Acidimicrobiales bacterium]